MSDLIRRQGVSAWLSNMGHDKLADMVMGEKRFPSTDPKAGNWVGIDEPPHEDYECDRCGYVQYLHNGEDISKYKFCPNCGSYNGGEEE